MTPEATLYDRIGGDAGVQTMLQRFYARVLSDRLLQPFFEKTEIDKLLRMQQEFFATALGGPTSASSIELSHTHAGRGISAEHFNAFCQHLLDTLRELDLAEQDILDVVHRISLFKNDITGDAY